MRYSHTCHKRNSIFSLPSVSNRQFKYKNEKKTIFYRDVKKVKEINQKFKTVFYATDLLREPPHFHMYNLGKVDAYSEPHQIPKVDLFAITTFNRFKSLTVFTNSSTSDA